MNNIAQNNLRPVYVFDADGVLFDGTMDIMGNVFAESLAQKYGIPQAEALPFYLSTGGQPVEEQYRGILAQRGLLDKDPEKSSTQVRQLTEYFQSNAYRDMPRLCQDVRPAMEVLNGRRMVISTNAPQKALTKRVEHYGLNAYFIAWFGRGFQGITDKKNQRQPIMDALKVTDEEFQRYGLLVGDGTRDIQIATEWRIRGIGRPTKDTSADQLIRAGAIATVDNLVDLLDLEKRLF